MKYLFTPLIIFLIPLSVYGSNMNNIQSMNCAYVVDNHYTIDPRKPMSEMFKGSGVVKSKMTLRITDIDLTNGTAKMIGNGGTSDIQVLKSGIGLIFIEMTPTAFHTYIVYDAKTTDMDDKHFPTIQSRNGLIGGVGGISSQLAGVCRAKFK